MHLSICNLNNSPPSAAWCQIPLPSSGSKVKSPTLAAVLKSNSLLLGKGKVSNARGMPGGEGIVEVTN